MHDSKMHAQRPSFATQTACVYKSETPRVMIYLAGVVVRCWNKNKNIPCLQVFKFKLIQSSKFKVQDTFLDESEEA